MHIADSCPDFPVSNGRGGGLRSAGDVDKLLCSLNGILLADVVSPYSR